MKKKKLYGLDTLTEFFTDHLRLPTKKEVEAFIRRTEQSVARMKIPTRAEYDGLLKRIEALEKAVRGGKKTGVAGPAKQARVAVKKRPTSRTKAQGTGTDKVLEALRNERGGADVGTLKGHTGIDDKKLRDILFRLTKNGKIKRVGRGLYTAKA